MLDLVEWLFSKMADLVTFVNSIVLLTFNGSNVTLLGFLGAIIIVSVFLRVFLPKN